MCESGFGLYHKLNEYVDMNSFWQLSVRAGLVKTRSFQMAEKRDDLVVTRTHMTGSRQLLSNITRQKPADVFSTSVQ